MRIGLTYDLRAEYLAEGFGEEETAELDREDTIEAIDEALASFGHEVVRVGHARALVGRLASGERWDLVFNIAEGIRGAARESQVPALLDVYAIPYTFSDPLVLAVCLDKSLTKLVVRSQGIRTPDFAVCGTREQAKAANMRFPLFVKPLCEGTSKGITGKSKVDDESELTEVVERVLRQYHQPALVERYLPGREVTVGIVGTGQQSRVVGSIEVLITGRAEQGVYSYENKKTFEESVTYVAPARDTFREGVERVALQAWRALGARDGGRVDVRLDDEGQPSFIECNPLAGLNPTISDLAIISKLHDVTYRDLIGAILKSACERLE